MFHWKILTRNQDRGPKTLPKELGWPFQNSRNSPVSPIFPDWATRKITP